MSKEWLQRRAHEVIVRSTQFGINRGLKPEGKPHFNTLVDDFRNGQEIVFSRYIHMLDGYDYESNIYGLENLEQFKDQPILVVANHLTADPLRGGHGKRVVINYYVNKVTQKEIRWLHGRDKTTPQDFVRKDLAKRSNTLLVRDDDPQASLQLMRHAFRHKDTIGLNPEGDGNKTLLRGLAKAGQMILYSTANNYPIVCVATYFKKNAFYLFVDPPLDNKRIKKAAEILKPDDNMSRADKEKNRQKLRQLVSDYAMARIALHLPEEKRGYYRNPQEHIKIFERLITQN